MNQNSIMRLSVDEMKLVTEINKIFCYDTPEKDMLEYILINIKIQGSGYLIDIMNISSLGIPIFAILASSRKQSLAEFVNHLKSGSVNFYDCKDVLVRFLIA